MNEKICPFTMYSPMASPCQQENCMAWIPTTKCPYFDECKEIEDTFKYSKFRIRCQEINGSGKCYGKYARCALLK